MDKLRILSIISSKSQGLNGRPGGAFITRGVF
jgi:hypothetical protein